MNDMLDVRAAIISECERLDTTVKQATESISKIHSLMKFLPEGALDPKVANVVDKVYEGGMLGQLMIAKLLPISLKPKETPVDKV